MASMFDEMKKTARDIAEAHTGRISEFDRQIAEIEKQKANVEAERTKARHALQRAANFPVKNGADYLCPLCWVDEGKMSPLQPVPSPTRDDIFRCRLCHYEAVIPG